MLEYNQLLCLVREIKAQAAANDALAEELMRKVQLEEEEEEKQRGAAERVW